MCNSLLGAVWFHKGAVTQIEIAVVATSYSVMKNAICLVGKQRVEATREQGNFYRPKVMDFSGISSLSAGPDKNRYRPNFPAFSSSRADGPKLPARQSNGVSKPTKSPQTLEIQS